MKRLVSCLGLFGVLIAACSDDEPKRPKNNGGSSTGGRYMPAGGENSGGDNGQGGSGAAKGGVSGDGGKAGSIAVAGEVGDAGGAGGGEGEEPILLTVTTSANVRPISPLIYGINPAHGVGCANPAGFTLCRLGGNPWSTYNWENNASNAGADGMLCSENTPALGASDDPADTVVSLIEDAGEEAVAVVTVPMLDYVAADKMSGAPYPLCTGDIRASADYQTTRLRQNRSRKGDAFEDPPDTTDGVVSQDEFLSFLKTRAGNTDVVFTLDNQPELWGQTHIALHPAQTTYAEVIERSTEYAQMIRDNWPGAEITGYGGYGYYAFLNLQDAPNRPDAEWLDYYLASMRAASETAKVRLIDYLDVHWYPEFPDTPEDRVQAPRSLWDPDYVDASWIGDFVGAIELVPWLQEKIDLYYPDTKIAISAYAYGGVDDPTGAVAVADALGVFGREGVALAALEPQTGNNTFNVAAVAAYRNYDGAGATFGDRSVRALSSDIGSVAVYASTDSQNSDRVVVIAINRSPMPNPVRLEIEHGSSFGSAAVYRVSEVAPNPVASGTLTSTGESVFETTLPGYSVSVIVPKP